MKTSLENEYTLRYAMGAVSATILLHQQEKKESDPVTADDEILESLDGIMDCACNECDERNTRYRRTKERDNLVDLHRGPFTSRDEDETE